MSRTSCPCRRHVAAAPAAVLAGGPAVLVAPRRRAAGWLRRRQRPHRSGAARHHHHRHRRNCHVRSAHPGGTAAHKTSEQCLSTMEDFTLSGTKLPLTAANDSETKQNYL